MIQANPFYSEWQYALSILVLGKIPNILNLVISHLKNETLSD